MVRAWRMGGGRIFGGPRLSIRSGDQGRVKELSHSGRAAAFLGAVMLLFCAVGVSGAVAQGASPFRSFLESLWPEAKALGVSRATFDKAFAGLNPDLSLPDLVIPGRAEQQSAQAEFTKAPQDYISKSYIERLAKRGRELLAQHRATLERIEAESGVNPYAVLAIWGRETAFGAHRLGHDAIRVLATQAYVGRRKELFRTELLHALKMLEDGVPRADMRSSWAGAMGLTQFLPTEFYKHGRDHDGDGRIDLFGAIPDALASAARQLEGKGWVRGQTWGYEVRVPPTADCSLEGPGQARSLGEWAKLGFRRAFGRPWPEELLGAEAYLMMPAGGYGPAFLVLENYRVIRRYNTSDLYAVFVGHLADRIAGGGDFETPCCTAGPQRTRTIEGIQKRLGEIGYDIEKIDGKVGSNTRRQIGAYQKASNLKIDCWPSDTLLAHMMRNSTTR